MRFPGSFVAILIGLTAVADAARAQTKVGSAAPATTSSIPAALPFAPASSSTSALLIGGSDDCASAGANALFGPGTYAVNTQIATDSPQIGAGCTQAHRDVWFEWTASQTSPFRVELCNGTTTDAVLAVWAGATCPTGVPLACGDDECNLQPSVTFSAVNGGVYLIQIGVYGASSSPGFNGTFDVVALPPAPTNDECSAAIAVSGVGTFAFDNTSATTSTQGQGESPCLIYGTTEMQRDVWFTWTAPNSGVVEFTTCGFSGVDTKIAAYPGGGCPSPGTALACADDSCPSFQSTVQFAVTAGAQYTLQIGVYPTAPGGTGMFSLDLPPPPPPPIRADVNVDIGPSGGPSATPSIAYAAASGRAGKWNARSSTQVSAQLDDLAGTPCGSVLTRTVATPHDSGFTNAAVTGDAAALLNDAQDVGGLGGTTTWTFSNLYGGNYAVYTYAWAPDDAGYRALVTVAGSTDAPQTVGGAWSGAHALGVTYALHRVDAVPSGGSLSITVATDTGYGTLNGFQLVEHPVPFTSYCFGDGSSTPCPCGNAGAAGNGCANSVNPSGARLVATGVASVSADTVRLQSSGMPNSSCLYFQGTSQIASAFGDGLRCAGGSTIRLGTKSNVGGASRYPEAGDQRVSVRGLIPAVGAVRKYQSWYRNAAMYCTISTYNLTNGVDVTWLP